MKRIARFVVRPVSAIEDKGGDLILGSMFKTSCHDLKCEEVYEIREVLGELTIVPIGRSLMRTENTSNVGISWSNTVNEILEIGENIHLITEEEEQKRIKSTS